MKKFAPFRWARDRFAWDKFVPLRRGDDEHYGVVHYGTDPEDLNQTAKGHIRLNRAHPETIFRVRMEDLKPQTTYYYKVTSEGGDGESDGVESRVNRFTTPAPGERIVIYGQPK